MNNDKIYTLRLPLKRRCFFFLVCGSVLFFLNYLPASAQENPPRPISVNTVQNLSFGAFSQGIAGGTVTVDPLGLRSGTGDVILLDMGYLYFPAVFEVDANRGTVISILYGSSILNGSGGGTMTLNIDNTSPLSPFITTVAPPGKTQISFGGTLTVGNPLANPPGDYSGTFSVTFNQE